MVSLATVQNFTGTRILLAAIKDSTKPLLIPVCLRLWYALAPRMRVLTTAPVPRLQLYMLVVFTLMFATALYLMERGEAKTFVDGQVVRVFADGTRSEIDSVFAASWVILVTYVQGCLPTLGVCGLTQQPTLSVHCLGGMQNDVSRVW